MTTLENPEAIIAAAPADELLELQLRVARRADVLARQTRGGRDSDRRLWLRAEYEVLEWMEQARPVVLLGDRHQAAVPDCGRAPLKRRRVLNIPLRTNP